MTPMRRMGGPRRASTRASTRQPSAHLPVLAQTASLAAAVHVCVGNRVSALVLARPRRAYLQDRGAGGEDNQILTKNNLLGVEAVDAVLEELRRAPHAGAETAPLAAAMV